MSLPDFQQPRTRIGPHPLPWSIQPEDWMYQVLDAAHVRVGVFDKADMAFWRDIVDTLNSQMPVSEDACALTVKQAQALDLIERWRGRYGVTPSFQELADHLGLHSKSGVHRLVKALKERGRIDFMRTRARAISIRRPLTDQERKACKPLPLP